MQDPQENQKFSVQDFAAKLKEKYPQYAEMEDYDLVQNVVKKFPQYANAVDLEEPKKKDSTESQSTGNQENTRYSASESREDLLKKFRDNTGYSPEDISDEQLSYTMARLYPNLKSELLPQEEEQEPLFEADEPIVSIKEPRDAVKIIDKDPNEFQRMLNRSFAASEIGKITARSYYGGSIDFEELAYYQNVLVNNAPKESDWLSASEENTVGAFLLDVVRTIPESFISLIDASLSPEAAASAGAGAAAGAAVGTVFAPVTAGVGAAAGAAFAGSGMLTFGTTLLQKLAENGVDITDSEELQKAWENKEFMNPLAKEAAAKAGIVGAFDAISAGIGGQISKSVTKAGVKSVLKAETIEYFGEGLLGGAGEGIGSLAAGDELNWRDIALETAADPAAAVLGRGSRGAYKGIKTSLKGKTDPSEDAMLSRFEKDPEDASKKMKVSTVENAEKLGGNKKLIKELEGALENAPKEQKKAINDEIKRLTKENTEIHDNTLSELDEYSSQDVEEMSAIAEEMVNLVASLESPKMTEGQKEAVSQIVERKNVELQEKRAKAKRKPRGKKINVSSTDRKTGAPAVSPEVEEIDAQRRAEIEFLENMDVSPEANYGITTEEERQDAIKKVNEKYDSQIANIETGQDFDFAQPDAAQGFEEFFDSEDLPITQEDEVSEAQDFEMLQEEIPDINPDEAPKLVQKRLDNKGREVKSYSIESEEEGVKTTEYFSEREGKSISQGGVVFEDEAGFEKLLENFNITEDDFREAVGEDMEKVILTESRTDGNQGSVSLKVKTPEGLLDVEIPFMESEQVAEQVSEEVDDSLSEEGKQTVAQLKKAMQETLFALQSKNEEDISPEDAEKALSLLGQMEKLGDAPAQQEVPASVYLEDAFPADESFMDVEDMEMMDEIYSGQSQQKVLSLDYIKNVSESAKGGTLRGEESAVKKSKDNVNGSLTYHLKEALSDAKSLTSFIAEHAMQGDEFVIGKAVYRVGEVTETKSKSTSAADLQVFKDLSNMSGKTNIKDALDVLYNKVFKKESTPKEEALLSMFETGRFKGIRDKKVSISDIESLLTVLEITGKDGPAAIKQAFAMSKDRRPNNEMAEITERNLLVDKDGKAILSKEGYKQIDPSKISAQDSARFNQLLREASRNKKMRQFFDKKKEGKFKELFRKENPVSITQYMMDRGIETRAGKGVSRTVKFARYQRSGEKMPTAKSGVNKDVIKVKRAEVREFKKDQYTASIKDGNLTRKAIKSDKIVSAFEKLGSATYTRFKEETVRATKEPVGNRRREVERIARVRKTFSISGKAKELQTLMAYADRPKNKSNLVSAFNRIFKLSNAQAEGAAEISHRLIQNMARRAGVPVSEIYNKITLVRNEFKGEPQYDAYPRQGSSDSGIARAVGTILRRFGTPISESNLDENGNPIDYTKLDQSATPITTEFKKYKQKGVEDSFTAQMIEDLKKLGVNVMSMKGDIESIIIGLTQGNDSINIRTAIGSRVSRKSLLDDSKASKNRGIRNLVINEIAAFYNIKFEDVNEDTLATFEIQTGKTLEGAIEEYALRTRGEQNGVAKSWLDWLDGMADALDMGDITIQQYSKAFNLVNTSLNFNFSLENNPDNKLSPRSSSSTENLTPFVSSIADEIIDGDGNNPILDYTQLLSEKTEETSKSRIVKKNSDGTYWVKYNHSAGLTYEQAQSEVEALTFATQKTSWCTKTAAQSHLQGGNFHILFSKEGRALTAIRQEGNGIAEERGNTSDQSLIPEYNNHLLEYKENGFVEGYNPENDSVALQEKIKEAKESFNAEDNLQLYLLDIAESNNPEAALEAYIEKSNGEFDDYVVAKDGVNEIATQERIIVPKNRRVVLQSSESSGRIFIPEIVFSNQSVLIESNDITIGEILESPSSKDFSSKGYYPEIVVKNDAFKDSKNYGDVGRVLIDKGIAAVTFEKGIGAVEVVEGKSAWITDISFKDNIVKDGNRFRSFAEIPDRRNQKRITTYDAEVFDREGYFDGVAYDKTWSEGARFLNQEMESQATKEDFIKKHLSEGDEVMGYKRVNSFKTKAEAQKLINKTKKDYPALNFKVFKKIGLVTNVETKGEYFIHVERNPKYKLEKGYDANAARAAIALVDGEAVIFALTNPNVSSPVHELAHMYEEYLTPAEVKVIEKFAGAKRGTVEFSETFARGFERFLADGKAPTPELKSVFAQFKEWMINIYKAIVGSPIEKDVTPEVREIFENMVMVEGDVNFRETEFNSEIVGSVKGKIRKLNQQDAIPSGKGGRKSRLAVENSNKKIATGNALKDLSTRESLAKNWSERQAGIRNYFEKRGMLLAENAMNNRAGVSARAAHVLKPIVKRIYDSLSVEQENTLNEILLVKRVIQIEKNREAKREYAAKYLKDFQEKRAMIVAAMSNLSGKELKIAESSLEAIDKSISKVQAIYNNNRLYKVDSKGIETGELAFKHPQGMTVEDAMATLKELEKRSDYKVLENRSKLYFNAMRENLKDLYEGGLINKETYDRFKKDDYIPRAFLSHIFAFQTDLDGEVTQVNFAEDAQFYKSIGLGEEQIKQLAEGSEGDLIVNSRYLLEKAHKATAARVLKNRAANALAKEMDGKSTNWYREGLYEEREGEPVADAYGNYNVLKPVETGFQNVYYLVDGKRRAFALDTESFNQWNDTELKFSDNKGIETVRKWSGVGLLKAAATGANPLFFLANVPMDMAHVLFFTDVYDDNKLLPVNMIKVSRNFGRNATNLVKLDRGIDDKGTKRTKELLDIYMMNGGGMDFLTQQGQGLFESSLDETKSKKTQKLRNKIGKVLGYTGNTTELAMRLATVEQVMKKLEADRKAGKNKYTNEDIKTIAVGKARATMDFAQGGLAVKQLDRWIPYLNAASQAIRVSRKYLSTSAGRRNFANKWAQASVGVAMITFYNLMMNDDEDEDNWLDDVPNYIKDNYFVFRNPFSKKDEEGKVKYIRIRKTPQVAPFLNLSEAIAEAMYYSMYPSKDHRVEKTLREKFARAVDNIELSLGFVPTGSGALSKLPPAGQGLIKYVANFDPFRQMNIVPENEINKILPQTEGMRDDRVPTFYKVFAEATGFSPKRTQAAVESVVTSPSTNAIVALTYGLADASVNAIFDVEDWKKSRYSGGLGEALSGSWSSAMERVYRETNPNWRDFSYERSKEIKQIEGSKSYEMNAITDYYAKKKDTESMKEFLQTVEIEADRKRLTKRYNELYTRDYSKVKGNVGHALDVKYARDPEAAAQIFDLYYSVGNLSSEEGVADTREKLKYLKDNFDFTPSSRFIKELRRLSKKEYKY